MRECRVNGWDLFNLSVHQKKMNIKQEHMWLGILNVVTHFEYIYLDSVICISNVWIYHKYFNFFL